MSNEFRQINCDRSLGKIYLEPNLLTKTKVVSFKFPIHGWETILVDDKNTIFVYEINKYD